jgi:GntR family transcriptional regulator
MERHEEVATEYAAAINAGEYDSVDRPFPSLAAIGEKHGVALNTAQRALDKLAYWGLVTTRKGHRTTVNPPELRIRERSITDRYARARAARGLIFQTPGMTKDTLDREWVAPPEPIKKLLEIGPQTKVLHRRSQTTERGTVTELTSMFFPRAIVKAAPQLDEDGPIKVVELIEATGRTITSTRNSIVVRPSTKTEADALGIEVGDCVIEHTHGTFDDDGEPVEAVINVCQTRNTMLTFDTYEGPIDA